MKRAYKLPRNFTLLGAFLQRSRYRTGLTQREVSLRLGYSSARFISNFERGISRPPVKKLRVLTKLYRLDQATLIDKILCGEAELLEKALGAGRRK